MRQFLLFTLIVGLIVACQDVDQQAGGTASEGENFVYGTLKDSSANFAKQTKIYLTQADITDEGIHEIKVDSAETDDMGEFTIPYTASGSYFLQALKEGEGLTRSNIILTEGSGEYSLGELGMNSRMILSVHVNGLAKCTESQLYAFLPGIPKKFEVRPPPAMDPSAPQQKPIGEIEEGRIRTPPLFPGKYDLGFLCDNSIQYITIDIPGGCPLYVVVDPVELLEEADYPTESYYPFETEFEKSVLIDERTVDADAACHPIPDKYDSVEDFLTEKPDSEPEDL